MPDAKAKIESLFETTGRRLYRNRIKVLLLVFVIIGLFIYRLPSITIDTSSESLLHKDDPSILEYNRFREQFGRSEMIIIAVQAPNVFEADFLSRLKSFHHDLEEEIPYLREVHSLINARDTRGEEDQLIVEDLFEDWSEKIAGLDDLKHRVLNNPFYLNHLISEDGRISAVVIETEALVAAPVSEEDILDDFAEDEIEAPSTSFTPHYFSEKENREVVDAVKRVVKRYHAKDFALTASGGPIVVDAFNRATMKDIQKCIVMSLVAVAFFLAIIFWRLSGVILPMLVIVSSLVSTLGLMAWMNVPIKITTTVIPAFLLAVGVCDAVHVLAIFYRRFEHGSTKEDAIAHALGHSGLAIVMTSLTTVGAVLSFVLADLAAIAEIGYFAAAGVMLALVYTILMFPALLALTPLRPSTAIARRSAVMDDILRGVARFSAAHPITIVVVSLVIFAIFFPAIFTLKFSHNVVRYFPDSMPYRHELNYIDQHLKGTITLELVLDTGRENGVHDPWILNRIEMFCRQTEQIQRQDISVGKVYSITDILKEIHQALNENSVAFYRIPRDRQLIAQEFLLFENSGADDLERIVDSQFSKTRITIKTPWVDAVVCKEFSEEINRKLQTLFQENAAVQSTGLMSLLVRAIVAAIYSMAKSYVIAFAVITLLMILLIGDWKIGLLSMVPNLLPIIIAMGCMGLAKIPLDINSLMIGSIALGIVVDDTVHFMYNFQRYYHKSADPYAAIEKTLLGTGRALLITSLVLCTGFFILLSASLNNFVIFGFFTGVTILIALLADFILVPALMLLIKRKRQTLTGLAQNSKILR
jgi:predicted RND superfamily exporter protein